jgi:glycosyltransferase involved in cell wall biosynthesis
VGRTDRVLKVVITLPAYRAAGTLRQTVAAIPEGIADELILVDDASPDDTVAVAREIGTIHVVVHEENRGYGGNQKTCYLTALAHGAEIVVMLHPDYQYEPRAVPLLIAPILSGDADMTFGSRFAGLSDPRDGGMPMYRYLGNRVTSILENLVLGTRFTEMHSGMRAYTRECLLAVPFEGYSDAYLFDSQLLVDAVTLGRRVIEVPIPTRYTKESSSIALGPSMRYVGGSLAYCVRQVLARGRRGRRRRLSRSGDAPAAGKRPRRPPEPARAAASPRGSGPSGRAPPTS